MKKLLVIFLILAVGCATTIRNQYAQQEVAFTGVVETLVALRTAGKINDSEYKDIDKIVKLGSEYLDVMSEAVKVENIETFDEFNRRLNILIETLQEKYDE